MRNIKIHLKDLMKCILWIDSKAVSSGANPLAIFTK